MNPNVFFDYDFVYDISMNPPNNEVNFAELIEPSIGAAVNEDLSTAGPISRSVAKEMSVAGPSSETVAEEVSVAGPSDGFGCSFRVSSK